MSLVLNVEILGEFKNLTAATKGAQSQLTDMNKRAQSVSKAITGAFAAIGIGFSLRTIVNELQEASKAAIEDNKSQILLAESMRKTIRATDDQIKSVEKYISVTELRTQILDDKLRPAMAIALRSTGDLTKAQALLNLAVDVSVGTGKDLEIVTKSIARAYDGNYTGLQKLVPGISKNADALDQLRKKFDGAAEAAAKTDPYMQMQVIFNDMQEKIGMALLPVLNKFSEWLSTPEGQQKLQGLIDLIVSLTDKFTVMLGFVIDNKEAFLSLAIAAGVIGVAIQLMGVKAALATGQMIALGVAAKTTLGVLGLIIAALQGIQALNDALNFDSVADYNGNLPPALDFSGGSGASPNPGGSNMTFGTRANSAPVTIIQNIQATQSAEQIASITAKFARSSGTTILRGGR